MEASIDYNPRSLFFNWAHWWYCLKASSFCSWFFKKSNFSCESRVSSLEDQGQSFAFLDKLYFKTTSFLSCCGNHKLKRGLEHFRTEVHLYFKKVNILNLKLELQSLKKGNDSVNGLLQKIKIARDKVLAVGVIVNNEELICIVLQGLPREYAHFCSAIWTKSDPISYEQVAIMLQSKEQAMTTSYLLCFLLIVNLKAILRINLKVMVLEEDEVEITSIKGEEVDTITIEVSTMEFSTSFLRQLRISLHRIFLLRIIRIKILLRALKLIVHHVRFVGNLDIKL